MEAAAAMVGAGGAAATVGAERGGATAQGKAPADRAAAMVQERAVAAARAGTEREAAATARVGAESAAAMGFADVDQIGLWPLPHVTSNIYEFPRKTYRTYRIWMVVRFFCVFRVPVCA